MKGILYIVATPIGNLNELSKRTIDILSNADFVACEDTRQTLKLLNYLELKKKLITYHRHNEEVQSEYLISQLNMGKNVALVSDAGMPGICDPGHEVIKKAILEDIKIEPISGPCSLINAIVGSGLDSSEFIFLGFLPTNKKNRREKIEEIKLSPKTIVVFEPPHRIEKTLKELSQELDKDRKIVIARELTKIHEEFIRTTIGESLDKVKDIKGECILVIEKSKEKQVDQEEFLTDEQLYSKFSNEGFEKKEIIKKIAKIRKVPKNEIYSKFLDY